MVLVNQLFQILLEYKILLVRYYVMYKKYDNKKVYLCITRIYVKNDCELFFILADVSIGI